MEHEVRVTVEGTKEAGRGIGCLAFAAIPVLLVVGAVSVWFSAHANSHILRQMDREESAQKRADGRVGASELPKAPIRLVLSSRSPCLRFESGYLDNGSFVGYLRNHCHHDFDYYEIHYSAISPDGTVIAGDYHNTATLPEIGAGEKAEVHFRIPSDDRVVEVRAVVTSRD